MINEKMAIEAALGDLQDAKQVLELVRDNHRAWLEEIVRPQSPYIAEREVYDIDVKGNPINPRRDGLSEEQVSGSTLKALEDRLAKQAERLGTITATLEEEISHGKFPQVGRVMLYTNLGSVNDAGEMIYPPTQQAFLITAVDEDGVHGNVYYKGGGYFPMTSVPFSETFERGHWSWPGV